MLKGCLEFWENNLTYGWVCNEYLFEYLINRTKTLDPIFFSKTNYYDLAFGLGENYSFMWGAGVLSGLEHERYLEYTGKGADQLLVNSDPVGHSLFFMLGHHGFGFETLVGYRMNFIKTEFYDSNIPTYMGKSTAAGKNVSYEDTNISLTTSQLQLGIGVTF